MLFKTNTNCIETEVDKSQFTNYPEVTKNISSFYRSTLIYTISKVG